MNQSWIFGPLVCDLWHSVDVLASTSSILPLCVISLDRYWAITDPFNYPIKMSDKRWETSLLSMTRPDSRPSLVLSSNLRLVLVSTFYN